MATPVVDAEKFLEQKNSYRASDIYHSHMVDTDSHFSISGDVSHRYEQALGVRRALQQVQAQQGAPAGSMSPSHKNDMYRVVGTRDPNERLAKSAVFVPKLLSGSEICERQRNSTIFIAGPEDPAQMTSEAFSLPRPVTSYHLGKVEPAKAMGAQRAVDRGLSSFALSDMEPTSKELESRHRPKNATSALGRNTDNLQGTGVSLQLKPAHPSNAPVQPLPRTDAQIRRCTDSQHSQITFG